MNSSAFLSELIVGLGPAQGTKMDGLSSVPTSEPAGSFLSVLESVRPAVGAAEVEGAGGTGRTAGEKLPAVPGVDAREEERVPEGSERALAGLRGADPLVVMDLTADGQSTLEAMRAHLTRTCAGARLARVFEPGFGVVDAEGQPAIAERGAEVPTMGDGDVARPLTHDLDAERPTPGTDPILFARGEKWSGKLPITEMTRAGRPAVASPGTESFPNQRVGPLALEDRVVRLTAREPGARLGAEEWVFRTAQGDSVSRPSPVEPSGPVVRIGSGVEGQLVLGTEDLTRPSLYGARDSQGAAVPSPLEGDGTGPGAVRLMDRAQAFWGHGPQPAESVQASGTLPVRGGIAPGAEEHPEPPSALNFRGPNGVYRGNQELSVHLPEPNGGAGTTPSLAVNAVNVPPGEVAVESAAEPGFADGWIVREDVLAQLEQRARWLLRTGLNEAEIRLQPPELGKIRLRLTVTGTSVHGFIEVENPSVKAILLSDLPRLSASLAESGLDLNQFDVLLQNERRSPHHRESDEHLSGGRPHGVEPETEETNDGVEVVAATGGRILDYWT